MPATIRRLPATTSTLETFAAVAVEAIADLHDQRVSVRIEQYDGDALTLILASPDLGEVVGGAYQGEPSANIGITDPDVAEAFGHALIAVAAKARALGLGLGVATVQADA